MTPTPLPTPEQILAVYQQGATAVLTLFEGLVTVIRTRMAIQVKKWKRNVQAPVIQQVRGSLGTHEKGLIITTKRL